MDFSQLFQFNYYFTLNPQAGTYSTVVAIYFLVLLIFRAHMRMVAGKHTHRKTIRRLQKIHLSRLAVLSVLGILNISARHVDITFFSMRIWTYILLLWSFYELYQLRKVFTHKVYAHIQSQKKDDKYIPKQKKKRKKTKR